MAEMNPFYIEPMTIWNRISRVHKGKQVNEIDIIEWSAECETEYIEEFDYFVRYDSIEIEATLCSGQKRFYLPCLVYRLLDVVNSNGQRINYVKEAGYLRTFNDYDTIYINYIGIPVSDEGMILIDKNHAQAVEAFIVHQIYYEDYLLGKLHPNMWQTIQLKLENELIACKSSFRHWDQSRFETMSAIKGNMVPQIAKVPLFRLYNTSEK